jgi:hypothetical protein
MCCHARLLNCAMHPLHCAKVDVRTHVRKGSKGREFASHHFSQGRRRQHTAPPSFSRGTELQDHATLAVPHPSDAAPHSVLRSPSKSRTDHERPHTAEYAHRPLRKTLLRPSPTSGRNRISLSVATHDCRRDIVRGGAVPAGVPHPQWATAVLLARSSRILRHDGAGFHLARRLPTRCRRCVPAEVTRPGLISALSADTHLTLCF